MGKTMNAELSMRSVRRLLERNHLAYTIEGNSILFDRWFDRRTGEKSYYQINFTEGADKIGRQYITFGYISRNMYDCEDIIQQECYRETECTDMAFFAFHFRDLFPEFYPVDEYNDWY